MIDFILAVQAQDFQQLMPSIGRLVRLFAFLYGIVLAIDGALKISKDQVFDGLESYFSLLMLSLGIPMVLYVAKMFF